jgi:hypothetical protein
VVALQWKDITIHPRRPGHHPREAPRHPRTPTRRTRHRGQQIRCQPANRRQCRYPMGISRLSSRKPPHRQPRPDPTEEIRIPPALHAYWNLADHHTDHPATCPGRRTRSEPANSDPPCAPRIRSIRRLHRRSDPYGHLQLAAVTASGPVSSSPTEARLQQSPALGSGLPGSVPLRRELLPSTRTAVDVVADVPPQEAGCPRLGLSKRDGNRATVRRRIHVEHVVATSILVAAAVGSGGGPNVGICVAERRLLPRRQSRIR